MKNPKPWRDPELLRALFDFDRREVRIKPGRKQALEEETTEMLKTDELSPGHAAKLEGRLFFLTASLFSMARSTRS